MQRRLGRLFSAYRFPLLMALGLRLATSLWMALLWFVLDPYFPLTGKALQETYDHLSPHPSLIARMFLDVWLRWDAVHYLNLAQTGYAGQGQGEMNFWPLFPALTRLASFFTLGDLMAAGLLVSTLATALAAVLFWKLVLLLFQDENLANWSVAAWIIFPSSFFLVAPFSDSLYACLALASLLCLAHKQRLWAGFFALWAGLTRTQGLLLIIPLLIEIGIQWVRDRRQLSWRDFAGLGLAPWGYLAFLLYRSGLGAQDFVSGYFTYSRVAVVNPLMGLWLAAQQMVGSRDWIQVSELLVNLAALAGLGWMLSRPDFRRQPALMAYGFATVGLTLSKHNLAASPLQSSNRYILNVLPVFIGIAWLLLRLRPAWQKAVITISIVTGMVLCSFYALWMFVG